MTSNVAKVVIVVPVYRPWEVHVQHIQRMARMAPVLAVDDGSPREAEMRLVDIGRSPGVTLLRLGSNNGIAAALNAGVAAAIDRGAEVVFTFDQDSEPRLDHLEMLLPLLRDPRCVIGAVGPGTVEGCRNRVLRRAGPVLRDVRTIIQSGMGFSIATFRHVGAFDESLVIDGVDTDYCLRLRKEGFRVAVHAELDMGHSLGAGSASSRRVRIFSRSVTATFHSASRRYYVNRNLILLLRKYAVEEPRWALDAVVRTVAFNVAAGMFETDKSVKARAAAQGLLAGLRGERGVGQARRYQDDA